MKKGLFDTDEMTVIFLGTGTSHGIPVMMCNCNVCCSIDSKDKRTRSSVLLEKNGRRLLIDCGPDFRQQYIFNKISCPIHSALLTHIHYDHTGGLDDLRPFSYKNGFDIYAAKDVIEALYTKMPYCFVRNPFPGVPQLKLHEIEAYEEIEIEGFNVTPLTVMHGKLPIFGYKIDNLAYITDALTLPDRSLEIIKGSKVLVIDALRINTHISHMNLEQALNVIKITKPQRAFLTHISHELGLHSELTKMLPDNVRPAFDGEVIKVD